MTSSKDQHTPSSAPFAPDRDDIANYQRSKQQRASSRVEQAPSSGGGTSMLTKLVLGVLVIATAVLAGGALTLYKQLQAANHSLTLVEKRVLELESRLSVTDESMEESAVAMRVKLTELDSEVRKLWDNVWKRSKQRLADHDQELAKLDKQLATLKQSVSKQSEQVASNQKLLKKVDEQTSGVRALVSDLSSAKQSLTEQKRTLESASDRLNRVQDDLNKVEKRVKVNEEWVESINGFRRQVNQDLTRLKQRSAAPATTAP